MHSQQNITVFMMLLPVLPSLPLGEILVFYLIFSPSPIYVPTSPQPSKIWRAAKAV